MKRASPPLDIFEFAHFRDFLKAHADARRHSHPGWSYRVWARQLGLSSPATLSMILQGKRHVGPKLEDRLSTYFRFSASEKKYFGHLLKVSEKRQDQSLMVHLQNDLALMRKARSEVRASPPAVTERALTWYFFALREMTLLKDFREDHAWIKSVLRFDITDSQITEALEALTRLGFLKRDVNGKLVPAEGKLVPTSSSQHQQRIQAYHTELLKLSRQALETLPAEDKGFFSSTITCSQANYIRAKDRIQRFQKELSEILEDGVEGDATYVFNFQTFALVKT